MSWFGTEETKTNTKKKTTQEQNGKNTHTESKPESKENLNQQSTLKTAHTCVCITVHNYRTL